MKATRLDLPSFLALCYNPRVSLGDHDTTGTILESLTIQRGNECIRRRLRCWSGGLGKLTLSLAGRRNGHAVVCACPDAVCRSSKKELRSGLIEEVDPTLKFVPTSRRYAALAAFMTSMVGITAVANAQHRDRQTPDNLGDFAVPLLAYSGAGSNLLFAPVTSVRQWNPITDTKTKSGLKGSARLLRCQHALGRAATVSSKKMLAHTYPVSASMLGYSTASLSRVMLGATTTIVSPTSRKAPFADGFVSGTVRKAIGGALEAGVTIRFYSVDSSGAVSTTPSATVVTASMLTTDLAGYAYNFKATLAPGEYEVVSVKGSLRSDPVSLPRLTIASAVEQKSYNFRMQPAYVFGDGIQLISTPGRYNYTTTTTRDIFGLTATGDNDGDGQENTANDQVIFKQFNIADWTGTEYNLSPDLQLQVGKGYFVRFGASGSVITVGAALPGNTFTINLAPGWNLIGHPFVNAVNPNILAPELNLYASGQIQEEGGSVLSMDDAIRLGKVRGTLFGYTGSNNGSQYYQGTVMKPWFGYWFRNLTTQPMKLILQYPTSRAVSSGKNLQTRSLESKGVMDYRLQLAARQGRYTDTDNSIGVSPAAKDGFDNRFDTQKPPKMTQVPGIYLAIEGENETGRSASFADMIRAATPGAKSWDFTVETAQPGEVTLFWPNMSRLPKGLDPYLVDVATGKRTAIRSASAYRYQATTTLAHRFRVEVIPSRTRPLALTNVRIAGAGRGQFGASYRISFNTTQVADVAVEVQAFGGRSVRRLQTRASGIGETGVTWDGRDSQGAVLPAGSYILVLTAKDEAGSTVRQSVPLVSIR